MYNFIVNKWKFKSGWLAPDCTTYSCGFMEHIDLAEDLCKFFNIETDNLHIADDVLLERGWVKVGMDGWIGIINKMNNQQFEFLESRNIRNMFEDDPYNIYMEGYW